MDKYMLPRKDAQKTHWHSFDSSIRSVSVMLAVIRPCI